MRAWLASVAGLLVLPVSVAFAEAAAPAAAEVKGCCPATTAREAKVKAETPQEGTCKAAVKACCQGRAAKTEATACAAKKACGAADKACAAKKGCSATAAAACAAKAPATADAPAASEAKKTAD